MNNDADSTNGKTPNEADAEYRLIDLRGLVYRLWQRKRLIVGLAFTGMFVAWGGAFLIHPQYDATVRLMPPAPKETSLTALFPTRNSGDLSLGLISSRTVADDVIAHQHLAEYFHTSIPTQQRRVLAGMTKITVDKDQFVTVTVRAKEPETAVRIANEFPEALYRLNHAVSQSEAEHRWEYFEGPLEQEKNKLAEAEEELKQAQQKTGMVLPDAQVRAGVTALSELKQQVTIREAELAALETGSTAQNPRVVELRSQIASMNGQVHQLEAQNGGTGTSPSAAKLPELTLEVERKAREVKFHETLFEILSRQYENARVGESYSPPVELVDHAVLADEKSWPPRKLFALLGLLIGGFLGTAGVCLEVTNLRARLREFLKGNVSTDATTSR